MHREPSGYQRERQQEPLGNLTVCMPPRLLNQIEDIAYNEGIDLSDLVRQCLVQYLKLYCEQENELVEKLSIEDLISLANHHHIEITPEEGIEDLRRKLSEIIISE